ncbi:AMP binding protein [Mycena belliarum]|uniref:AMP binding protein n=1 Tax=Mycena belliarum TaxID=1033014 RepID=A0AAD6UFS8_9AGAR|nr:AMP binding protein [Mycena belliae]
MSPTIYASSYPSIPLPQTSIFTRLFASQGPGDVGGFPGTATAFIDAASGSSITRAELRHLSLSFAHGLRTHPATRPLAKRGDTVLIYSPNSLAWPVVLFGSVAAGLRCTTANSAYTSAELAHQYTDSGARLVIAAEAGLATVRAMLALLGISKQEADRRIIVLGRDLRWAGGPSVKRSPEAVGLLTMEDLLKGGQLDQEERFDGALCNETTYLCYSSGTTGKPKGVETTHLNIVGLLAIILVNFPALQPHDVMLGILPFYHIYALTQVLHLPLVLGLPTVVQTRFEPVEFCANIEKYKASISLIVPPILVVLARHPAAEKYDLSTLRYMCSGAAPLGKDLVRQVKQRLLKKRTPGDDLVIVQGYGLTETSPTTHILAPADCDRKMGSIGPLLPNLEARLVDDDDGNVDAEEGKPGELWVRGPTVMKGYLNNPTATENSITPDGWFKTGDVAIRDKEGHYYIVDRRKELIKYKGFPVPPAELESVLLTHPDIADTAVIGVEDIEEATELPRAYVVHAHPERVGTEEAKALFAMSVAKWMETRVARHKFLRGGVAVIDAIPKSAAGKILRRELRDRAKQEQGASQSQSRTPIVQSKL